MMPINVHSLPTYVIPTNLNKLIPGVLRPLDTSKDMLIFMNER